MNPFLIILSAITGLLIGGVINWLADDLPYTHRVRRPHYPDGSPRPVIAWLGVLAFITGNRASPDGAKIGWRHPITELVTAAFFAYVASAYPFGGRSIFWMGYLAILILITVIDLEHRLILFIVIIPACIFALIGAAVIGPEISDKILFKDYLIGGGVGFGIFLVIYLGGILFSVVMAKSRGEELDEVAFGYGDVMLATLCGLILGWQALSFAMMITVIAGGVGALLYILFSRITKGKYDQFTALPYGQYIVLGTVVMLLWGGALIQRIQPLPK